MDKLAVKTAVKAMETEILDQTAREKIGGTFIKLDSGTTKYQLEGNGENVVLVHGYATPYFIYDKLFDALVNAGYRVLRYDLLGRGFSDRPDVDYTPELFATQLNEITSKLLGDESFILVGTSMGGSITVTFTAKHSSKVKKLILLAPAGMDSFKPPLYMKICKIPVLGEAVFYNVAGKLLLKKCASEMYYSDGSQKDEYMRKFADSARYKGFLRSTLSSLRNTILRTDFTSRQYAKISELGIPTLCIWGTIDKTMPYYQASRFKELMPKSKLITYLDSGHIFVYDEGKRTATDVIKFIEEM